MVTARCEKLVPSVLSPSHVRYAPCSRLRGHDGPCAHAVAATPGETLVRQAGEAAELYGVIEQLRVERDTIQNRHDAQARLLRASREARVVEVASLRAEVEMFRGVGCSEDGDGPCGVCLKCARRERDEARAEVRAAHSRECSRPFTPDRCPCAICTMEKKA